MEGVVSPLAQLTNVVCVEQLSAWRQRSVTSLEHRVDPA